MSLQLLNLLNGVKELQREPETEVVEMGQI